MATGGFGTQSTLWSAATGKRIRNFDSGPIAGEITPVFSPDGTLIAVGNRQGWTRVFEVATGRWMRLFAASASQELKFDPTGERVAVAYVDGTLGVWNVSLGRLVQRVKSRAEELVTVDWSPDGTLLASAGRQGPVTIWKAADLTPLVEINCPDLVACVRFNPEGTRLLFAGGSALANGEHYIELLGIPHQ